MSEYACVNVFFGPPEKKEDDGPAFSRFFALPGAHVVCGGTTARIAARHLGKTLTASLSSPDPAIPPIGSMEGIELVTEGAVTLRAVLDMLLCGSFGGEDAAGQLVRLLMQADRVVFFTGNAHNPGHDGTQELAVNKSELAEQILSLLRDMGKKTFHFIY